MLKNRFDMVMDYIDENIEQKTEDIKKGLIEIISYNSNDFKKCFEILTNEPISLQESFILLHNP